VVDYMQGDLQVGDVFVLLTDGVHGVLSDGQLQALVAGHNVQLGVQADAQAAAEAMVQAALKAGSLDNATAMVARVRGLLDATLEDENRAARLPIPGPFRVGEMLDGLTVTAPVADNGINVVVQVRHPVSKALYALKTLHPSRAHDPQERAMLAHEAWLAKRMLSSRAADHLVVLHDTYPANSASGQPASAFYLLYDWHSGETLQHMLDRGYKFSVHQAVSAARQVAQALGRLHQQHVIHRDIKPANLHQSEDGVLRLLDLGVALSGREPEAMRKLHAGTPSYINPEQWGFDAQGGDAKEELPNAQSDLFALGVTLYQLLTHKLPYGDVLPYQVGRYYRDPIAPSRHNPEIPIWLDHVVQKAVARDQRQRFETGEEFLLALERGASRPLTAPPASPLLQRDPTAIWKLALLVSGLFNLLLIFWLLFLPK
jgi:serine/threonine protein kinase